MHLLKKCRPDGLAYEFYGRINFAFPQNTVLRPRSREAGNEQLEPVSSVAAEGRSGSPIPSGTSVRAALRTTGEPSTSLGRSGESGCPRGFQPDRGSNPDLDPDRLPWLFCAGFTAVDVEIGTFSGLSQIQISFFGGGGSSSLFFSGDEFFASFPSVAMGGNDAGNGSGMGSLGSNANSVASGNPGVTSPSSPITTSITPLNPSLTATQTPGSITPVFIVPPPLPPIVVHLGSSVSPVTEQAIFSPLAALDEQPTSVTHFGQTLETELQRFFKARLSAKAEATPLIDYVEPFDAVPRPAAPAADPAPQVDHSPAQTRRPFDLCPRSAHRPSTRSSI